MNGELGFQDALNERVSLLAQCPTSVVEQVLEKELPFARQNLSQHDEGKRRICRP